MCGNYASIISSRPPKRGSPPRVRELRHVGFLKLLHGRITPACAGITQMATPDGDMPWDHPRVCGNYPGGSRSGKRGRGSPPRVRELLNIANPHNWSDRITPACAGITIFLLS